MPKCQYLVLPKYQTLAYDLFQQMQPMETVSQQEPLSRNLQVSVTEDAAQRIKVEAAKRNTSPGRVISKLAAEHLPAVTEAA